MLLQLSRQDAVRYCGDSKDEKQPKLHAPMPALPWWFSDDIQQQLRDFDPSKHATTLPEVDASLGAGASPSSEQLRQQLRTQLEYYFSRENLITDRYLRCQMDSDQYVPIKIIASFPKITQLTSDIGLIVQVLRESPNVQVDDSGEKVRAASRRCTILIREIPETEEEEVKSMLEGTAPYQSLTYGFNNTWYVTFETEDATQRAFLHIQNLGKTFNDKPICARIKTGGCPLAPEPNRSHSATPTDLSRSSTSQKPLAASASASPSAPDASKSPATTPEAEHAPPPPPAVPTIQFDLGQILMGMGFMAKAVYKPGAPVVHLTANSASEAPLASLSPGVTINISHPPHHPSNGVGGARSPVRGHRSPRASPLFFGHGHSSNFHGSGHNGSAFLAASSASNGYHSHYRGGNNSGYGNSKHGGSSGQYSGGRRSSNYEYGKFYKGKRSGPPANGPSSSNAYLNPPGMANGSGSNHRYRNGSYSNRSRPRFPTSPSRMQAERNALREVHPKREIERLAEITVSEPERKPAEKKKDTLEVTPSAPKRRTTSASEATHSVAAEAASSALTPSVAKPESVYSFEEGEFPSLPEKERKEEKNEEEKPPPFSVIVAGRQKMEAKREAEALAAANRLSYAQKVAKKGALAGSAVSPTS
ncbi:hypothetical protein QR680_009005 [Steinernema hermaphroditum]|uniref:HTH La-type RNA-binding domain-containing protein n=1 Tax=Steinernema hermaphroditum TaxID=289476 RepID=A0AA39IL40_9BILA|nr:hypothetical protein QR680_009005 [Steinernema hermaphroditum]